MIIHPDLYPTLFRNLCRCFPIEIGKDDPFFGPFGRRCLDLTRSSTHCSGDQGDQVNTVTAFLDGSVIYGASEELGLRLRGGARRRGGRLVGNAHLPHFLPSKFDLNIKTRPSDKATDFVAGDARAETQVLRSMTILINWNYCSHLYSRFKTCSSTSTTR